MKKISILFIYTFVVSVQWALAQDTTKTIKDARNIIKWSYLSLFDLTPSVQFAYEHKLKPLLNMQIEAGYISDYAYSIENFENMEGFRIRSEIRKYNSTSNSYFAPELMYKHIWYERTDQIGIDCNTIDCAYYRTLTYEVNKRIIAFHILRFGIQKSLFHSDRIIYDLYGGIGGRYVFFHTEGIPANATILNQEWDIFPNRSDGYYLRPSFSLGIKFGYIIN